MSWLAIWWCDSKDLGIKGKYYQGILTMVKWRPTFLTKIKFGGIWDWLLLGDSIEPSSLSLGSSWAPEQMCYLWPKKRKKKRWAPISSLRLDRFSSGRTLQMEKITHVWRRLFWLAICMHENRVAWVNLGSCKWERLQMFENLFTGYFDWQLKYAWEAHSLRTGKHGWIQVVANASGLTDKAQRYCVVLNCLQSNNDWI